VDKGKEFYNKLVEKWCKDHNIHMYSTGSDLKSVFAERFNRTQKESMEHHFQRYLTAKYSAFLPRFLLAYNARVHSSTRETPSDVYHGKATSQEMREESPKKKPKFKVGDVVRTTREKGVFTKGYKNRYTYEAFRIREVDQEDTPVMYKLEDLMGEDIEGRYYEPEMIPTKVPQFKVMDDILKEEGDNVLVSYVGYPKKFNAWVPRAEYDAQVAQEEAIQATV
jgi:hypothetical protein